MSSHKQLISILCRLSFSGRVATAIGDLKKNNITWSKIFEYSQKEQITCFLYNNLKNNNSLSYIPSDIRAKLENTYYANFLRNNLIIKEANAIIKCLKEEGIETIVLKGIFLGVKLYDNIALRPSTDIDILVSQSDVYKAGKALESFGYIAPACANDFFNNLKQRSLNSLMYQKNQSQQYLVHLHWHIVNTTWPIEPFIRKIDMEKIWLSAQSLDIEGANALALAPNHLLLYLCQHAFTHHFDRLILALDIVKVLDVYKDKLDWGLLIEEAQNFGLLPILYYSLRFVSRTFELNMPQLKEIKSKILNSNNSLVVFFLNRRKPSYKLSYFIYFLMEKGLINKLKFITRTLFPSRYIMAHNFSIPLNQVKFWYYLLRLKNNILKV